MPQSKGAKKSLEASQRRQAINNRWRRRVHDAIKAATDSESVKKAQSIIDRATRRHIMHANKAARLKSRLAKVATK